MNKDAGNEVIEMIKRRIEESHQTSAALDTEHDALRREQEYGKRRALLDLWQDVLDAM